MFGMFGRRECSGRNGECCWLGRLGYLLPAPCYLLLVTGDRCRPHCCSCLQQTGPSPLVPGQVFMSLGQWQWWGHHQQYHTFRAFCWHLVIEVYLHLAITWILGPLFGGAFQLCLCSLLQPWRNLRPFVVMSPGWWRHVIVVTTHQRFYAT